MIPIVGFLRLRRSGETNGLIVLRTIYLGLVGSLILWPVAFRFIGPWDGGDEGWMPWVVVPIGIFSLVWITRLRARPLLTTSLETLAGSYRALFFLGVGFAEVPLLCAIVVMLLRGSFWICLVGLPFSLVGMGMVAPSQSDIERRQREITASGSPLSLSVALSSPSRGEP
jgi:hypothetical protein